MPDTKISALPAAATVGIADLLPLVQGGVSKQITTAKLWNATPVANVNYTILPTDVLVYTSAAFTAPHTWTLPTAASYGAGRLLRVSDVFGTLTLTNNLTIQRAASDTVNGAVSIALNTLYGSALLSSDGVSKWSAIFGGGVTAAAAVAHQWLKSVDAFGNFTQTQPATGDLSTEPAAGNAAAGQIGEYIESFVNLGTGPSLTTGTVINITSIALTAGDWDVFGFTGFQGGSGCVLQFHIGATSTSPLAQPNDRFTQLPLSSLAIGGNALTLPVPTTRYSLASPATVYLTFVAYFSSSATAPTAFGRVSARRMR